MTAIGRNILLLPLLNPVHVAEEAATLDVLTGGKYILGVGLGYRARSSTASASRCSERAPRFVEAIQLMRRLWTEDRVTFDGTLLVGEGPRHRPEAGASRRSAGLRCRRRSMRRSSAPRASVTHG